MQQSNYLFNNLSIEIFVCRDIDHDRQWNENIKTSATKIWIVTDGEILLENNQEHQILHKGDIYFFQRGSVYQASCKSKHCSFIYIHFDVMTVQCKSIFCVYEFTPYLQYSLLKQTSDILQNVYIDFIPDDALSMFQLKGAISILLSKLILNNCFKLKQPDLDMIYSPKISSVLRYIDAHFKNNIRLEELSKMASMSEKYFITYFRKYTGTTPHQYIINLKMRAAYDMLSRQEMSVYETAVNLGYPDQYCFSKTFKSKFGFPPSKA